MKSTRLWKFRLLFTAFLLATGFFSACSGDSGTEDNYDYSYDYFSGHTFYGYKEFAEGSSDLPEGFEAGKYDTCSIKFGTDKSVTITLYNADYDDSGKATYDNIIYTGTYTFANEKATITFSGKDEKGTVQTKTIKTSSLTSVSGTFTISDSDISEIADGFSTTMHKRFTGEANAIRITYDANFIKDGETESETVVQDAEFDSDGNITLKANTFTRDGYKFKGWATYKSSTYVSYADEEKTSYITSDTTLYAVWIPNTFTITFNANFVKDGATEAETATQSVDSAKDLDSYGYVTLAKNTFSRGDDYIFLGWGTYESSTYVSYKDGGEAKLSKDTTLYAIWLLKSEAKKIIFNINDGSASPETKIQYVKANDYVTLDENTFTRAGYTFKGWAKTSDSTTKEYSDKESYFKTTDDITLYAVWKDDLHCRITFDANGGEGEMAAQTVETGKPTILNVNAFTNSGYVFYGWNTYASSSYSSYYTISYVDGDSITLSDDKKLYAVWLPSYSAVKITYNANDGTSASKTQYLRSGSTSSYYWYNKLAPNTFTREGFTFKGWGTYSSATYKTYSDKESYVKVTSDTNLYALWDFTGTCTVTFNANDGTDTPATSTQEITGSSYTSLNANTFTREGYTFTGWATEKDADEAEYADSYAYFKANSTTLTLYAVWKKNLTVTFNGNGGTTGESATTTTQTIPYDTKTTLAENPFTQSNKTFAGWATNSTATKGTYDDCDEIKITENLTLYAVWITPLDVTLDPNGGTGSAIADVTKYSASEDSYVYTFSEVTSMTKSGYALAGWSKSSSATTADYKTGDSVKLTSAATFYAVWVKTTGVNVYVSAPSVTSQTDITLTYKSATHSLEAALSTAVQFIWLIDGKSVEDFYGSSLNVYTISEGMHTVTVIGIDENGGMKSASLTVTVTKN